MDLENEDKAQKQKHVDDVKNNGFLECDDQKQCATYKQPVLAQEMIQPAT